MRILHVLDAFRAEAGGVVQAVIDMCAALARAGHELQCLTLDDADAPQAWLERRNGACPTLHPLRRAPGVAGRIGLASRVALQHAARLVRECDVVHLHTPWAMINPQLAAQAHLARKPYILTAHGMLDDWSMSVRGLKKRLYLRLRGASILENAAFVHCTADAERDQAQKWFPKGRAFVAPLMFNLEEYASLPPADVARKAYPEAFASDGPRALFLSRVHPKKGVEILLDAFRIALEIWPDAALLIAGPAEPDYERALRRRAEALGVSRRTFFLGMVRGELKRSLYRACDILAVPTSQENFGLVFVEALMCGLPVITTRGVDIWEELNRTGAAAIVDQAPEPFARAIMDFLSDRDNARARGAQGRRAVQQWLDPARVIRTYETMYEQATAQPGACA